MKGCKWMWNDINEKTPPNDQSNKAQAKAKQKKSNKWKLKTPQKKQHQQKPTKQNLRQNPNKSPKTITSFSLPWNPKTKECYRCTYSLS